MWCTIMYLWPNSLHQFSTIKIKHIPNTSANITSRSIDGKIDFLHNSNQQTFNGQTHTHDLMASRGKFNSLKKILNNSRHDSISYKTWKFNSHRISIFWHFELLFLLIFMFIKHNPTICEDVIWHSIVQ